MGGGKEKDYDRERERERERGRWVAEKRKIMMEREIQRKR